jgi:urease accessory protein
MPRTTSVIAADQGHGRSAADTVILDHAQRSAAQGTVVSVKGVTIDVDLHGPVRLRTDDLLQLENGDLVEVVAAPEPLIEVRAADVAVLARLAWHLGDRHIQVELLPNRIRAKREAAAETLLTSLGAKVTLIEAPFEPEGGAYALARGQAHHHDHHGHDHSHDHGHDHGHAQDHRHDEHCGHDHGHDHRHK